MDRFLADEMNGDLARWLRILGYDCKYFYREGGDEDLIREAEIEGRVVLTGDRGLYRECLKRGVKAIYTEGATREERLADLAKKSLIDLSLGERVPRCSRCNTPLEEGGVEEVRGRVPRGVLERYKEFWICPSCGKVYWEGSHWRGIKETVKKARKRVLEGL